MPVKSAIARLEQFIVPVKAVASVTWISRSPLVLIAVLPNKYALKLVSGTSTMEAAVKQLLLKEAVASI